MLDDAKFASLLREDPMLEKAALIAELYYIYKLSQKEIADQLGISRPWVSKLLKRAEEEGIVTIRVETAWAGSEDLEEELQKQFSLKAAKVVRSSPEEVQTLHHCARAASHYLISALQFNDIMALSWGYTLAALAEEFVRIDLPTVSLVPLVGGMGEHAQILSNYIVDLIATKTKSRYHLLHLPAFVAGKLQKESLLMDPHVHEIIQMGERADIIMCSIGPLRGSTMARDGYLSAQELDELEALGAVGDIALQFIDQNGKLVKHPIRDRLVSGNFETARKHARNSVVMAVGKRKVPVIRAALRGGWLDTLVTDTNTAKLILEL